MRLVVLDEYFSKELTVNSVLGSVATPNCFSYSTNVHTLVRIHLDEEQQG